MIFDRVIPLEIRIFGSNFRRDVCISLKRVTPMELRKKNEIFRFQTLCRDMYKVAKKLHMQVSYQKIQVKLEFGYGLMSFGSYPLELEKDQLWI
jgi:translation initiation factor 2 alpha subunit (eIF-2alpha)